MVPIASEVFFKANKNNDNKIFGFTTLDLVRASTFVAAEADLESEEVSVPVIGGHSETTIVPVFSQTYPHAELSQCQIKRLTKAVREAGTEIVKAKMGNGSATLSTAFALSRFTISIVKGLQGHRNVVECSFVRSDVVPECSFFSTPVELGAVGIKKNLGLPLLNEYENCLLSTAIPTIQKDIEKGIKFVYDTYLVREQEERVKLLCKHKLKCTECI
ncbi:malate dehydrogenase [Blattella germanica]|nr:malate dehydrogenase [Blattella germanica]